MFELPLVTVVSPSFNQGAFLEQTIQSVLGQDYPFVEYIVIDGGSTDDSVDIIRKYEKDIAYWVSEPDRGQSHAINKGFAKGTGSIVSWLNADDLLSPSAVRIAVFFLQKQTTGLVYGDRLHVDARGNVISVLKCPSYDCSMFRKNSTLPQETVFFRRDILDTVGGLDEELHFSMDFDLWCKMARVTQMFHIPAFMGCFREHTSAKSVRCHDLECGTQYCEEHERVYRQHFGKKLPSVFMMRVYRLARRIRLVFEQGGSAYRNARKLVHHLAVTDSGTQCI